MYGWCVSKCNRYGDGFCYRIRGSYSNSFGCIYVYIINDLVVIFISRLIWISIVIFWCISRVVVYNICNDICNNNIRCDYIVVYVISISGIIIILVVLCVNVCNYSCSCK